MKRAIFKKLHSKRGASLLLALLFMLVCLTVGAVVLTAAATNAGRIERNRRQQQDYLAVASAVELVKEDMDETKFVGQYIETWTETIVYTYGQPDPITGECPITGSDTVVSPKQFLRSPNVTKLTGSKLLQQTESDLIEFYYSTTPVGGSPSSMNYKSEFQANNDHMDNVSGTLSISDGSGKLPRYALQTTFYCGDKTNPRNMTTMTYSPKIHSKDDRTTSENGDVTTIKITYTTTVTWDAPVVSKGGSEMNILKKLSSRRGETLTETLVALLIVGLASGVLATMVGAASHMNKTAMERDEVLYKAITAAETKPTANAEDDITVTPGIVGMTIDSGSAVEFDVSFYSDENSSLTSYQYTKEVGAP